MKIKELEEMLGVERANIRYYESEQLISPKRTENSYRNYSEDDVYRLKTVIILRKIGVSIKDIRSVLNGQDSLTEILKENEQNLMKQMKELDGALRLCRKMESEQLELDSFDVDYYWDAIHQEEKKGQVFVDICKDYLEYEKGIFYSIFGDMDNLADRFGWEKRKRAFTVVAVVAYCTILGLFGFFVLKEDSFWESFRLPIIWFLILSLLYLPEFILRRKFPRAAEIYKKIVPIACAVVCGFFIIIVIAFVLLGSIEN